MDSSGGSLKSPQAWEKLWSIFHQASEMNPAERENFLESVDKELRSEVEELLSAAMNNGHSFEGMVSQRTWLAERN